MPDKLGGIPKSTDEIGECKSSQPKNQWQKSILKEHAWPRQRKQKTECKLDAKYKCNPNAHNLDIESKRPWCSS